MFNTSNTSKRNELKNRTIQMCVSQQEAIELENYNKRISLLNTLWAARKNAIIGKAVKISARAIDYSLPMTARKNAVAIKMMDSLKAELETIDAMNADEFTAYYRNMVESNGGNFEIVKQMLPSLAA